MSTGGGIGTDDWVASVEGRRDAPGRVVGTARRLAERVPVGLRVLALVALGALLPRLTDSEYVLQVGVNAILYAMLALGLNVVVGWAGMLDLGFVAFYGTGAYTFALLSSDQIGQHWPTWLAVATVVVVCALLGVLLGLTSRRLVGDYLAITTLFFAELFVQLTTNFDRLDLPFHDGPLDLTGGPNGITAIDPWTVFGRELLDIVDYYYLALVAAGLVMLALYLVNDSRFGRAWRAIREDSLAAEQMTIPTFRLRIFAFATGAAIAGLSGSIFASVQLSVFPDNFDVGLLIVIYAAVILGGAGSQLGVVLGALVIVIVPELLRDADNGRYVFYGLMLGMVLWKIRPWSRTIGVLAATVVFGLVVHAVGSAVWDDATAQSTAGGGRVAQVLDHWVLLPSNGTDLGNYGFVLLVAMACFLTTRHGWVQWALLVPTLYLGAFVYENRLVDEPSVTRQLLFGALLVVLMATRPQGLLGTRRVEIV